MDKTVFTRRSGKLIRQSLLPALLFFTPWLAHADIVLDGAVNEPEWERAHRVDKFVQIFPKTGEDAPYASHAWILSQPDGLYFATQIYQHAKNQVAQKHERDGHSNADFVQLIVDFSGSGTQAYEFFISLGDSFKDAIWSNENNRSTDWDGEWQAVTRAYDDRWEVEAFIPWGSVSMPSVEGSERAITYTVQWRSMQESKMYGAALVHPSEQIFMSQFHEARIANYTASSIVWVPYVSTTRDLLEKDESRNRAGLDVSWKVGGHQVNATINPDFGTAESDDLVVNFSSVETLLSDKRPFFTENQELFRLTGHRLTLVNTRRIGGGPDYDCAGYASQRFPVPAGMQEDIQKSERDALEQLCEDNQQGNSDISIAVKYNFLLPRSETGVFFASEGDADFSQGRDFLAFRSNHGSTGKQLGYLLTHVDNPVLDRKATVHAVDYERRFNSKWRLTGLSMLSDIDNDGESNSAYGQRLVMFHQPTPEWENFYVFAHYDRGFDVNDMGYVNRDNYDDVYLNFKRTKNYDGDSGRLRRQVIEFALDTPRGYENRNLRQYAEFRVGVRTRANRSYNIGGFYRSSGIDDLITFEDPVAPYAKLNSQYEVFFHHANPEANRTHFQFNTGQGSEPLGGRHNWLDTEWRWLLGGAGNLSLRLRKSESRGWLVAYNDDRRLTRYGFSTRDSINFAYSLLPAHGHELRMRAQWVGIRAEQGEVYVVNPTGEPEINTDETINNFSFYSLSFQLRYRWTFRSSSDLYVIYQRGGDRTEAGENARGSSSQLLQVAWNQPESEVFLIKTNYRF